MKSTRTNILLALLVLNCIAYVVTGHSQAPTSGSVVKSVTTEPIEVTLDNGGREWKFYDGESMPLDIVIRNLTNKCLKLRHLPVLNFVRKGSNEERPRFREIFIARFDTPEIPDTRGVVLKANEKLELRIEISQLELLDQMSSIDVWDKIRPALPDGDYFVEVDAILDFSNVSKEQFQHVRSQRILLEVGKSRGKP